MFPEDILMAVKMGIDLFDSSLIWDLSSKGQALISEPNSNPQNRSYRLYDLFEPSFL